MKKASEKTPPRSKNIPRVNIVMCEIVQRGCQVLNRVKMSAISAVELREIIKVAIEILNNTDSIEVASPIG